MNEREALKLALEALDCICSPLHVREIEKIGNAMKAIREALAQPEFVLNGIDCSCGRKWRVVNNTLTASEQPEQEFFVIKHYSADERPTIKGNGFDGLEIGTDREDAEKFIKWVNAHISTPPQRKPEQESDDLTIAYMSGFHDGKNKNAPQPEQELVLWRKAAIRVGEDLCSVGPFGYYDMTAKQWLDWALSVVTVHAPPPQRTWVGLTVREIEWCFYDANDARIVAARNIEAKLREKNT